MTTYMRSAGVVTVRMLLSWQLCQHSLPYEMSHLALLDSAVCTGLDFAYPEAKKVGGLASGPKQRAPAPLEEGSEDGPDITIAGAPRRAGGKRGWPLVCWSAARPVAGGWGEGSGMVAMDGAVVLAVHSDALFMEPLIAQV